MDLRDCEAQLALQNQTVKEESEAFVQEARRKKRTLAEAAAYSAGDRIRVSGLESETGRAFNGRAGCVIGYLADRGRWEVRLDGEKGTINLLPEKVSLIEGPDAPPPPQPLNAD